MTEKKEIAKYNDARDLINNASFQQQIAQVLPKHLTPDRMARLAIAAFTRNPKLKQCTQESIFRSMMDASMLGIEPDGRHGHLVPYGRECQFIPDYKGLAALLMETGQVKRIYAEVVCENDQYEENIGLVLRHVPNRRGDRGEPYLAYCIIDTVAGGQVCQIMDADEIAAVRKASPGSSRSDSPWNIWPSEMWKKTVFKRACKWMSLRSSARLMDAIALDDGISYQTLDMPALTESTSRLDAIAEDAQNEDS